jgi:TolB-like protein/DNA-binding winged helix-turn-helix (wHTH) protein
MAQQGKHIYEFGPYRLIPSERQLLRENQLVPLTPKSFDLLVVLVENSGHLLQKDELLKRIWPDSFVEEANLSVNMTALRRALGEGPDDHRYVETVPRHGYRFVADVKERWGNGAEITAGAAKKAEPVADLSTVAVAMPTDGSRRRASFLRWGLVVAGLLLLISSLVAFKAGGFGERLFRNRTPIQVHSLAVLPLKNVSGDSAQDYFADGMTDALINDLTKIDTIRVMSRPAVMNYKKDDRSPTQIGRELNVDAVLTGSVARTGDRVRVVLQLVDVPTGRDLWSAELDRDLRDVLALEAQVRADIAEKIGLKSRPQQQPNLSSVNAEAYDQYLRGRFYLYRQTREDNEAAIAALEKAVATEPNFAAAHAELAQAYVWKLFLFAPGDKRLKRRLSSKSRKRSL